MKFYIILSSFLLASFALFGDWERTYGSGPWSSDFGCSVYECSDNGYLLFGTTSSFSGSAAYFIKTDEYGNVIWDRGFLFLGFATCLNMIACLERGEFACIGWTSDTLDIHRFFYMRIDDAGDSLYALIYPFYPYFGDLVQTPDSGYIFCGNINNDVYIMRIEKDGDTLWTKRFRLGVSGYDAGSSIIGLADDNYIIVGSMNISGEVDLDAFFMRINGHGDTLFTRRYGISSRLAVVMQTHDGKFAICGKMGMNGCLIMTDSLGNLLWQREYGGMGEDYFSDILQTSDAGFLLCGRTTTISGTDAWLVKTDSLGDTLWTRTFGGLRVDVFTAMSQTSVGGVILIGQTISPPPDTFDIYLVKLDPTGIVEWESNFPKNISLDIFPNPFNSSVRISLDCGRGLINQTPTIEIFDITGKIVADLSPLVPPLLRGDVQRTGGIVWSPAPELPSGIYLVKAKMSDGKIAEKRVVYLK